MLNFSMLIVNNIRSKAYLQNILSQGFKPSYIIILDVGMMPLLESTENDRLISKTTKQKFICELKELELSFDEKEHVLTTVERFQLPHVVVKSHDINSQEVIEEVKKIPTEYLFYSGPSGQIPQRDLLKQGKKLVQSLPASPLHYRGDTTLYYSYLVEQTFTGAVMLIDEKIDGGPIFFQKSYSIREKGVNFDHVLDPLLRTRALIDFLQKVKNDQEVSIIFKDQERTDRCYSIVHPLLKHSTICIYNKDK